MHSTDRPERTFGTATMRGDGPSRMVKRPTGSGGEPSSPNCGVSAGGKARQLLLSSLYLSFALVANECLEVNSPVCCGLTARQPSLAHRMSAASDVITRQRVASDHWRVFAQCVASVSVPLLHHIGCRHANRPDSASASVVPPPSCRQRRAPWRPSTHCHGVPLLGDSRPCAVRRNTVW